MRVRRPYRLTTLRLRFETWMSCGTGTRKPTAPAHAARYVDFLQRHIDALGENHARGRVVESRPELRYIRISRRRRGHGHIAVYRVDAQAKLNLANANAPRR
jgi:plasmid stabilization system protein ParE